MLTRHHTTHWPPSIIVSSARIWPAENFENLYSSAVSWSRHLWLSYVVGHKLNYWLRSHDTFDLQGACSEEIEPQKSEENSSLVNFFRGLVCLWLDELKTLCLYNGNREDHWHAPWQLQEQSLDSPLPHFWINLRCFFFLELHEPQNFEV